jgi:DNA-binding beta-propeller fold protein YncE
LNRIGKALLATFAAALVGTAFSATAGEYGLVGSYPVAGDGGWDYLSYDATSDRLFVTRGDRVQVVNPANGHVAFEITDTPGVHGVALAPDLGKGYTSNGGDDSVTVFDMKSFATVAKIKTVGGERPDAIVYSESTKNVVTLNGKSHNASVIDAGTDRLVATIPLPGRPESAVTDSKGRLFVNIEDKNELAMIDLRTHQVGAVWPLAACDEPAGLALDADSGRLFVGCHNNTMLVVNSDSGHVVATLPIGQGVDANAFDAARKLVFSSQGDGTLTIIKEESPGKFRVQQTAHTRPGARTMALNAKDHLVYLVSADYVEAPPQTQGKRTRRTVKPGTFTLLVFGERH